MTSAAHLCGFEEVILLEEPKAAAYAFLDKFKLQPGNGAIVFDYGGGTIDIAYLMLTEDAPIFKFAPVSQSKCGGEYIDLLLHNLIISRTDPSCREVSPALLDTCSRMKVNFSESEREVIVYNGKAFMFDLALFNRIISKKVDVAISLLKEVVKRCNSCDLPIDFVFLNGGSSRLRLVTESISQVIPSAKLLKYDDVGDDLAVSIGAMLYHKLSSEKYSARNEETTSDKGEVKIKNDVLDKIRKQFNEAIKRSN
jgi:molecular chaperone DnaK (HSP70)